MAHFAQIDENNIVTRVLVIDQETVDTGYFGDPASFIQTSYNTHAGEHLLGGTPFRKNYAGVGYKYDAERDAFIPPKSHESWIFNEDTCRYHPPTPMPDDGKVYLWNEDLVDWEEQP